jgi:cell division protein FtsW
MVKIGKSANLDRLIEVPVLLLMATGTVFVFSAGANVNGGYDLQRFYQFTTLKHLLIFPLAVAIMYLVSLIDYRWLSFEKPSWFSSLTTYLLILSFVLLILVLIPGIGIMKNYSRRWLPLPLGPVSMSFQPSEIAKWSIIFFLAAFCDKFADSMNLYTKRFVPACVVAGLAVALIITQDFGTAAFIAFLTFLMLLIGRAKWWHFLTPIPVVVPVFVLAVITSPTRLNRIKDFLNTETMSYQARQSLIAISTGGIWGKGLGRGVFKYGHLPEDTTDFIFSIIAEELGFVGAIFVVLMFIMFIVLGLMVIIRCKDRFGQLLAAGIVFAIGIQAAVNIGVVTVVLPTKGIPLPFISAGGTSMLLSAMAVGVLLNIARQTARPNAHPHLLLSYHEQTGPMAIDQQEEHEQ